jgi:DNA replication protein DnaC
MINQLQQIIDLLTQLRLTGVVAALKEQMTNAAFQELSFEERVKLLLEREICHRDDRRMSRLWKACQAKDRTAALENLDYRERSGLDRAQLASLASCQWILDFLNLLIHGATGSGKTFLACALAHQACRAGLSAWYVRAPRLFDDLTLCHADGSFRKRLAEIAKIQLLIIDDFAISPIGARERNDLLELLDDRVGSRSTIVLSQLPPEHWHAYLHDPTVADAIMDRLIHRSHKIHLESKESIRKRVGQKAKGGKA